MSTIQREYKERWGINKFEKTAECFDVVASCLLQLISNCIKLSSTIGRPAVNDNFVTKRNNVGFNIQSEMSLSLILTQQLVISWMITWLGSTALRDIFFLIVSVFIRFHHDDLVWPTGLLAFTSTKEAIFSQTICGRTARHDQHSYIFRAIKLYVTNTRTQWSYENISMNNFLVVNKSERCKMPRSVYSIINLLLSGTGKTSTHDGTKNFAVYILMTWWTGNFLANWIEKLWENKVDRFKKWKTTLKKHYSRDTS